MTKKEMRDLTEQVARENAVVTGNGNKLDLADDKPGGAERGGPGLSRARDEQPPAATRPEESQESRDTNESLEKDRYRRPTA